MRSYFLTTPRLGFSTWLPGDLELARTLWGDPQVARFICACGRFSEQEIEARLRTEVNNGRQYHVQYWPIFLLETGDLVGCCGLRPIDPQEGVFEMGFHLLPACWGQRYAYEAATAVLAAVEQRAAAPFDALEIRAILAGHHPQNTASRKVLERLGFVYSHEEYYPPTGLCHPSYRYAALKKKGPSPQSG